MIKIMSNIWTSLFSGARERQFKPNEALFRRGDTVDTIFFVRMGEVQLNRVLSTGTALGLHKAAAGQIVADASLFADRYHCDAICEGPTKIAMLPKHALLARLSGEGVALGALKNSAQEVQALRARVEIMRLRRVTDRLDAYLDLYGPPEQGHWVDVADWIGATPPALYRELAKRRNAQTKRAPQ